MVIAENLAGSQSAFAARMTSTARAIGMSDTTFRNPHGLPDSAQVTTARDMATLGRALQDRFPQYYHYFSTPSFTWQGTRIANHNNLLGVEGVDGIKTGYTRASGYNLVTSIHRDGRYLVAVVMGGDSASARDAHMRDLIATNLPRASNGPRTAPLIATRAMDFVPLPRPVTTFANDPVMTAAIQPSPVVPVAGGPVPAMPVPVIAQGDIDPAPVAVAMGPPAPGWRIQIGAFPSEANALATLSQAAGAEATRLAAVTPYTETVTVGGVLHYRARFSGFANSAAAEAACDRLERHGFACFATQ
jgi:D-alanyl-D-alanine carboxypeptidase